MMLGMILPEPGYLEAVREITRRHGVVLIFNKVKTGLAIGAAGATGRYGVQPRPRDAGQGAGRRDAVRGGWRQRGARLIAHYPVSVVADGQGLNVTLVGYLGQLHFGLISCRELVPDLDVLAGYLTDELALLLTAAEKRAAG